MELSREQLEFLQECEEKFQNRYTDADEDFFKIKCSTLTNPPILDPWPYDTRKSRHENQRDSSNRHLQRRDHGRAYSGRYKEDRERYRDGRRKKYKRRSRNYRERSRERSADRRRDKDERRASGRKRRKHRKRSEDRSKGYSHRDEERDKRHRDEERDRRHEKRDDYYYRGRNRSRDRQRYREGDFNSKVYEQKRKDAEKNVHNSPEILRQDNEQGLWNMYVSKHNLYENYRPYF